MSSIRPAGFACFLLLAAQAVEAAELKGPARFCGYSPIIDLLDGEKVTPQEGGMHGGSFLWEGDFGSLEVAGSGWAKRPQGRASTKRAGNRPQIFAQRPTADGYEIAIWNGAQGVAYFRSSQPFTDAQRKAIERVNLFDETQSPPSNCDLRTVFVFD